MTHIYDSPYSLSTQSDNVASNKIGPTILLFVYDFDERHLRWRQKSHWWSPSAGSTAYVCKRTFLKSGQTRMYFIEQPCQQTERENLPIVGVPGKLQVEMPGAVLVDNGLVFQQKGKQVAGKG